MKLLIVGGSGFLSGTLARLALAQGHQVWVITRGQRLLPDGAASLVTDRHDQAGFQQVVASAAVHWDMVVDCIAFDSADIRQDIAVFRALADQFIFISTDFVYAPDQRRFPQNEETCGYLAEGYGGKKRQGELELLRCDPKEFAWTVFRPGHIYGPGSQLGCLPAHGRDPQLINRLRAGQPLQLVGGGRFLQQPILAGDLSKLILSAAGHPSAFGQIFCAAGPEIAESRRYYGIIAEILGVSLEIEELPVAAYLAEHPESAPFLCHRIYDLAKLHSAGLAVPATSLYEGLRQQVSSMI